MSLVDYASSSDDDVSEEQEQKNQQQAQQEEKPHLHLPKNPPQHKSSPSSILLSDQTSGLVPTKSVAQPLPSLQIEKLPDASVLLNSPAISLGSGSTLDHASQVSAAMAENAAQRKRDLNGGPSSSYLLPRGKVPRGTLPHSKNVPDTGSGMLVPPQLRGRSNVVTEDIGKLFVKRQKEPSLQ